MVQNNEKVNPSKIIGIQFSILSPEEIKNGSVAEINNRDTYINNKPVISGLFDPRMGILEPGMICPTDGLDYMKTPGYFGHIDLSRPVYYIQYLTTIIKILRCTCIKCSKLLISKDKNQYLLKLNSEQRWNEVFSMASKIKRCGESIDNGCGYKQPAKIKKENLATLIAEWDNVESEDDSTKVSIKLTPEKVIKLFRRISDEDVKFMGFNNLWCRPEWMICQTLAIPPPAIRPSIKHDSQQRSEDDITHIIVNIIKANKTLEEKINQNSNANIIDDWTTVLQYYVATLVDNKIPGVASVAQRSGRPLKSIKERLNGKAGRVRGNLMGKRVDFSARSVITPDPQLSIKELGVPIKIAKNLTKPVTINNKNKNYLTKLLINGPDEYPGAKILERKTGESISLRYVDRNSITLNDGDILHRHMMDGDYILFNRQPTLHRMSMMSHIVKIMPVGDTFRMNVGDTKPYNADFDGDEMNLHLPQNEEAEVELMRLAAIPTQIISPANNKSIIGIFQDSLLGCYTFTQNLVEYDQRQAMNLLMAINTVNISNLPTSGTTNFDILSQILPPISLLYKSKKFKNEENFKTSNNVIEIKNGKYVRGQMEKGVLGDGSKGLIQRIYNDYGNEASAKFIDDIQAIITEYMKFNAYSVGISDLIANNETNQAITNVIAEKKNSVNNLIDETHLGIFTNKTGKTNEQEFETQVNNILNKASLEAGKIGRSSLSKDNRFVIMVNAGSKGSDLNIAQMISCLGQQNVDGKRIPYGFESRTLPHYKKFDDSPEARGFIESSFISGLTPTELFFHAMGGRVGLIDTAVKTSQTGYISRRLIKSLEDLMVNYDMTVRNNKNKIIEFKYGDDNFDPIKVESQILGFMDMTYEEIYSYYQMPSLDKDKAVLQIFTKSVQKTLKTQKKEIDIKNKFYIDFILKSKEDIIKNIYKNVFNKQVHLPVAFTHIIQNVVGNFNLNENSLVDIGILDAYNLIENTFDLLEKNHYISPNNLFKVLYYYYLCPKNLLLVKRLNKAALEYLLDKIVLMYKQAVVNPGEMVGVVAAQSVGEPTTQMSETKNAVKKIIIVSKNGMISHKTIKIGELCDKFIEDYPEYTFPTGHPDSVETLLDKIDEEYYIIGVDKNEKTSWNRISHFSRHPVNGKLMTIKTKSGRSVTTTLSHSHLCRKEHEVQPIKGSELSIGMRIPVCKHIDNQFIVDTLIIGNENYKLDKQFGWFIGAYLAEGNCSGNEICITNIHEYYINSTLEIAKLFNITGYLDKTPGEYGPCTKTKFKNKYLAKFLLENCGKNSYEKKVPEFIFTAPLECKAAVLQGYMDGDGNINCDKNHHEIRGCSRSERLIKDLSLLFNYFDIFTTLLENVKQNKPLYHFAISSCYASIYKETIGSVLKSDKLEELCNYVNRSNIHSVSNDIDKIEGLGEIIAKCGKELKLPGQSSTYGRWKNKLSIGRRTLQKYLNIFKSVIGDQRILVNEITLLEQAVNSNIIWDEITNIEIYTPDQNEYVYDFTVPKNQTFMEDNGIIVHNTLNTFHFAGVASKSNVTRGVPRIEEILSLSENPKNPSCTVFLKSDIIENQEEARKVINLLEHTKLKDIVKSIEICFDPDDLNTLINDDKDTMEQYKEFSSIIDECLENKSLDDKQKSKWVIRVELNEIEMIDKNITLEDINFVLNMTYGDEISCVFSDYNSDKLVFRIRLNKILQNKKRTQINPLDQSDEIYLLKNFQEELLNNLILRGIKNISKVLLRKITDYMIPDENGFRKTEIWVLDTVGTNLLKLLSLDFIDVYNTTTNDIQEIYNVLGIEAARQAIYNELTEVIEFDSTYINYHHLNLLCNRMTCNTGLVSVFRHGINNDNIGPIAKASFEETPEQFLKAARHGELDNMRGVSANVMCGQEGYFGTSSFSVMLDLKEITKNKASQELEISDNDKYIEKYFGDLTDPNDPCNVSNLTINNNISNIKKVDLGNNDDYDPFA